MPYSEARYMAAVGMFDGLHTGHLFVLGELRRHAAARDLRPMVISFANHPSEILTPDRPVPILMSPDDKRKAINTLAGIERVEIIEFSTNFAAMTAADFLASLKDKGVEALAMGFNNHIGSDRLDAKGAASLGIIDIDQLPPCPGGEATSSSALRRAIAQADLDTAETLLGRAYTIGGVVTGGRRIGHTIGYPTANIETGLGPRQLLPPDGAYAADVLLEGESTPRRAMVNIGIRPTVDKSITPIRTIEAHILDFDADIYGSTLTLTFLRRLRPERRFASLEALRSQLALDAQEARRT